MSASTSTARPFPQHWFRQAGLGVLFALIAMLAVISPSPTAAWSAGTYSSSSENLLVQLTNQARANAGLRALTVDSTLHTEARSRSRDMIERDYFSHSIPPDGHKVFDELKAMGYCMTTAGENIGWNTYPDQSATQAVQDAFMASSGHRANILGSAWTVMGVGAYQGSTDKKMWTVLFAKPCSGGGATPRPPTPRPATPKPATPKPKPATPKPATPKPATPTPATPAPIQTPAPTIAPTVEPSPSASPDLRLDPDAEPFSPAWLWGDVGGPSSAPGTGSPNAKVTPAPTTSEPAGRGLRVADPPVAQGLFESIVGDVASTFFGS